MKKVRNEICFIVLFVSLISSIETRCPTNVTCSESETCCETRTGLWACCPFINGICCEDGIHCCPTNHICLSNGTCINNSSNHLSKSIQTELNDIQCDDGSSCPDGSTCCPLASGRFGCCPIPNATCCNDHLHCCPSDHQCDDQRGRCKRKISFPLLINEIVCPDKSSCPDGETCCRLPSGDYGCCPLVDAVCCSDQIHCCPHGSQCDVEHGQCVGEVSIPWFEKQPSKLRFDDQLEWISIDSTLNSDSFLLSKPIQSINEDKDSLRIIQCPDEKSFCPEETTCCQLIDDSFGCCPYSDGVCCSDKKNCCPSGYSCDQTGRCTKHFHSKENSSIEIETKMKIKMRKLHRNDDQLCPDGVTRCSLKTTCCPNSNSNSYSCCPYPNGVCCGSNGSLCCPNNYQCDEKQLSCQLKGNLRFRSLNIDSSLYQCEDSNVFCSTDETCCPSNPFNPNQDPFACCPFQNGQCCRDGEHCCPSNARCDLMSGDCIIN